MEITFHNDSTVSLGSFIHVLSPGRPIGRVFHVNKRLQEMIRDKYQGGES